MANVVVALLLREMRVRFGRSHLGYLWAILEPLGGVIIFSVVLSVIGRPPMAGSSTVLFLALGMLGYSTFRRMTQQIGAAFEANAALLSYPIVRPFDTLLARAMLESATGVLTLLIILVGVMLFDNVPPPAHFEIVAGGVLILALFGFGLGVINAVVGEYWQSWRHIEALIHRLFFLLSGIFFMPSSLPQVALDVISWNPILHGIEWLRYGYYEGYRPDLISFHYIIAWAFGSTLVGLAAERFIPRRRA